LAAVVRVVNLAARDTAEHGVSETHLLKGRVRGFKNLLPFRGLADTIESSEIRAKFIVSSPEIHFGRASRRSS
jgi:hypothetical protein